MLKTIFRPVYQALHTALHASWPALPLFPRQYHGRAVRTGFIAEEHLQNPDLDQRLENEFRAAGIEVKPYTIDVAGYHDYVKQAAYPSTYYGGGLDPRQNFVEKTLEHYVASTLLDWPRVRTFVDFAAATSPYADVVQRLFGVEHCYRQDLVYGPAQPLQAGQRQLGGYAHQIALPDGSVDAATLHCSLEHFEDDSDSLFFARLDRLLAPGGRCLILPFYLAYEYTQHVDPAFNLLKRHPIRFDPLAQVRYCTWQQYHSRHYDPAALQRRILTHLPHCSLTLLRVNNFRDVDPGCYLRWVGLIEKKADKF